MAGSDELEYLKSLVAQLNDKIKLLEGKASKAAETPKGKPRVGGLRTILVGPPGAGESYFLVRKVVLERMWKRWIGLAGLWR